MKSSKELVAEIQLEKKASSDRGRRIFYISDSLVSGVRRAYPNIPVSRLVEKFLRELLKESA